MICFAQWCSGLRGNMLTGILSPDICQLSGLWYLWVIKPCHIEIFHMYLVYSWLLFWSLLFWYAFHDFSVMSEAIIWLVLFQKALATVQVLKSCMSSVLCSIFCISINFCSRYYFVLVLNVFSHWISVTYHITRLLGWFLITLDFFKLLLCKYYDQLSLLF